VQVAAIVASHTATATLWAAQWRYHYLLLLKGATQPQLPKELIAGPTIVLILLKQTAPALTNKQPFYYLKSVPSPSLKNSGTRVPSV
jgi:hypothetical protein